ncbi:hypothetical protein C8J57DRAFT_1473413, partial [Mycena rebaudengoi]
MSSTHTTGAPRRAPRRARYTSALPAPCTACHVRACRARTSCAYAPGTPCSCLSAERRRGGRCAGDLGEQGVISDSLQGRVCEGRGVGGEDGGKGESLGPRCAADNVMHAPPRTRAIIRRTLALRLGARVLWPNDRALVLRHGALVMRLGRAPDTHRPCPRHVHPSRRIAGFSRLAYGRGDTLICGLRAPTWRVQHVRALAATRRALVLRHRTRPRLASSTHFVRWSPSGNLQFIPPLPRVCRIRIFLRSRQLCCVYISAFFLRLGLLRHSSAAFPAFLFWFFVPYVRSCNDCSFSPRLHSFLPHTFF